MSENTFTPAAEPQDMASAESMEATAAAVSTTPLTMTKYSHSGIC